MSAARNSFGHGVIPPMQSMAIAEVAAGLVAPSPPNLFARDLERFRRRSDWNARFEHWEKPASTTEESTLVRGQRMVRTALKDAVWLRSHGATVEAQGSYDNNTNTRQDSDADLRVQLPLLKVDYHSNVVVSSACSILSLSDSGWTYEQLFSMMRWELKDYLSNAFGRENVTQGSKAFEVKGVFGSRAKIDVVPAIRYQHIAWMGTRYNVTEGIAILSDDGKWTINFPNHHHANGVAKRSRTGHQFKKLVRIFKRLRVDLSLGGFIQAPVPSFLIESLLYNVEDVFFAVPGDDRLDRVRRVAQRLRSMVRHEPTAAAMLEINGLKPLFTVDQGWSWADAIAFADAVVLHLGDS